MKKVALDNRESYNLPLLRLDSIQEIFHSRLLYMASQANTGSLEPNILLHCPPTCVNIYMYSVDAGHAGLDSDRTKSKSMHLTVQLRCYSYCDLPSIMFRTIN